MSNLERQVRAALQKLMSDLESEAYFLPPSKGQSRTYPQDYARLINSYYYRLVGALLPLLASKDEVAPYEQLYNRVMSLLRATKMEHGLCEPRSRRACTHCNAVEELDKMLSEYKGARVIASNFRYQQIEGGGAVYTDDKPIEE